MIGNAELEYNLKVLGWGILKEEIKPNFLEKHEFRNQIETLSQKSLAFLIH